MSFTATKITSAALSTSAATSAAFVEPRWCAGLLKTSTYINHQRDQRGFSAVPRSAGARTHTHAHTHAPAHRGISRAALVALVTHVTYCHYSSRAPARLLSSRAGNEVIDKLSTTKDEIYFDGCQFGIKDQKNFCLLIIKRKICFLSAEKRYFLAFSSALLASGTRQKHT